VGEPPERPDTSICPIQAFARYKHLKEVRHMSPRKLGFVDVGARGGTSSQIEAYCDRLLRVLIEPEENEFIRLKALSAVDSSFKVVGTALGHIDGTITLFETVNPTCSSALQVNHDFVDHYAIHVHFAMKAQTPVQCARYDTLFNTTDLPIPHIIKIDVQGFEYQVLQGFGELLQQCLAIELETHFYKLYRDQKMIGDLVDLLQPYDFVLRKVSNSRSPTLNGDPHFEGDLIEVDATFTKNKQWLRNRSEHTKSDFAVACGVVGVPPYSE